MPEIITRADARTKGLPRYFTGEPCKHGHVAERQTSGKGCMACARETDRKRQVDPRTRPARLNTAHKKVYDMQRTYGIPLWVGVYIAEHKATGNCPGCGVKFGHPQSMTGAHIDHDHVTGEVRMIVCNTCNTTRLRNCDDGRNPDALLLAASRNVKHGGRRYQSIALTQLRLAALLLEHYAERSPLVAKQLQIPNHTPKRDLCHTISAL
jgi:hypothetical protein